MSNPVSSRRESTYYNWMAFVFKFSIYAKDDELMIYNIQLCSHTEDSTQRRLCKPIGKRAANEKKN